LRLRNAGGPAFAIFVGAMRIEYIVVRVLCMALLAMAVGQLLLQQTPDLMLANPLCCPSG